MDDGIDTQAELIELAHDPINPARPGTPGEGIYLELWRQYLAADENRLECILRNTLRGEPSQRQASVCASFMTYMGCNCGQGFTWNAERLAEGDRTAYSYRAQSFLAAWGVENRRSLGVNGGLRTIESMLSKDLWIDHPWRGRIVRWEATDDITTADYDTVDCMVEWWSGEEARQMRKIAEPMIQAANRKAMSGMFKIKEGNNHGS